MVAGLRTFTATYEPTFCRSSSSMLNAKFSRGVPSGVQAKEGARGAEREA